MRLILTWSVTNNVDTVHIKKLISVKADGVPSSSYNFLVVSVIDIHGDSKQYHCTKFLIAD